MAGLSRSQLDAFGNDEIGVDLESLSTVADALRLGIPPSMLNGLDVNEIDDLVIRAEEGMDGVMPGFTSGEPLKIMAVAESDWPVGDGSDLLQKQVTPKNDLLEYAYPDEPDLMGA